MCTCSVYYIAALKYMCFSLVIICGIVYIVY